MGQIGGDLASLDKTLRRLISACHRLHVVYEAGGFGVTVTLAEREGERPTLWPP